MTKQSGYTLNVKVVRGTLGVARFAGLTPEDVAREAGIDPALLEDADARFAWESWLELWRIIGERSGDRLVAIRCAAGLPKGHFDVIDYVIASSEDLGTAMTRFSQFFALISTAVSHPFEGGVMRRVYSPGVFTRSPFPAEFAFTALACRTREWTERAWFPERVEFAHEAPSDPADVAEVRRVFGCDVAYDAEESAIHFGSDSLRLRMREPAPELCRILDGHARAALERLPREKDLVETMRGVLASEIRCGSPSLDQCARRMGMGARTVHRRLAEMGTSHKKLLDEVRQTLAIRYLGDPTLSIGEVGFLLGFADSSAFYRAFRRWTGRTPAQYREK